MKKPFSTDIQTIRIVQVEADGVLSHGSPDPTALQIGIVDDQGEIRLLVFQGQTLGRLAGIVLSLTKIVPDAFKT